MTFNLWDILILVSLAQGLIFGFVVLGTPFFKNTPSKYLAFSVILIAVMGLNEWLSGWNFDDQYYLIDFFGDDTPWMLLYYVPIFIYFLKATHHPWGKSRYLLLLGLPFLLFLVLNIYINLDVDFDLYHISDVQHFMSVVYEIEYWLAILYSLCLSVWGFIILKQLKPEQAGRKWLFRIWGMLLILILCWLCLSFLPDQGYEYLDYLLWGGVSFFIYWLTYQGLYRLKLAEDQAAIHKILDARITSKKIENEVVDEKVSTREQSYMAKLEQLITDQQIHRNPNLSRDIVAEHLGISPGYLSQIINTAAGENFTTYINKQRVESVRQMLLDPQFEQYSLLAIGMEAGFKSKSAFNNTFKKITGMTPSTFQKSAHSSNSDNSAPLTH